MATMGVTVIYGLVAGVGFSLGPPTFTAPRPWLFAVQMTVPWLVIEALTALALRSRGSALHLLGVVSAGLVGLGAAGQGVLLTIVVIANMVGGGVPRAVGPSVLVAALVLVLVGPLLLVTAVVGWRETRRAQARSSSISGRGVTTA